MQAQQVIATHPDVKGNTNDALIRCIEECYGCVQTCTSCADAGLAEDMVKELIHCIRLCLDCAEARNATGAIATRRSDGNEELIRPILEACLIACRRCAEECERHAGTHEDCRICGEACRRCGQVSQVASDSIRPVVQ